LELRLTIFSVKTMQMRDVIIVPSTGWGGDGLLGLTILFCKIEDISEQAYRVLAVAEKSPAAKAGLRADVDFVLGSMHGRFESLEDLRDKAVQHVNQEWLLAIYDAELDSVREVALVPTPTWWPGHEGGAGILGCEFACGIVHRLPFVVPSSDELEKRVKASMPNRSPAISVYVDPLSPSSTPAASPAPPSFLSPPRAFDVSSPAPSAAAVVAVATTAPQHAAHTPTLAASAQLLPIPASHVSLPSPTPHSVAAPTVPTTQAITAATSDVCDTSDAIKAVDLSAVASPGRPVLKTVVEETNAVAPVEAQQVPREAVEDAPCSHAESKEGVDEKQLFQDVKAILSPKQFKTFCTNMKRLNGGSQTGDVTLSNVCEMFVDHPLLQQQLQLFIKQVRLAC
jgi:hypothetical protein